MPAHSTPPVQDDQIVRFSEAERRRDLILVDSMVRDGSSEWEIAAALRERHGLAPESPPAGSLLHRLGWLFAA